jgi:putative hydrolase of the HAD superfamily
MINKTHLTDIFFDLDHTLWDFEVNSFATFNQILSDHNFPFETATFMKAYSPINHAFWKLYRENKITTEELRFVRLQKTFEAIKQPQNTAMINTLSNAYINQLSTHTHIFEGTIELLEYLNPNYRLHIITNGFENIQQKKMANAGLAPYFDVVLTAEKAGVKKPHPVIFEQALSMAHTSASKSLMIGDSYEADIAGAIALGMQAIHFNSHNESWHNHCPIVANLAEIQQYL